MAAKKIKIAKKPEAQKATRRVVKKTARVAHPKTPGKLEKKGLQLKVLGIDGKVKGKVSVARDLFAAKINPKLVSQAIRVYLANQREGSASTKTRSEVEGSTRKIYRQKGTGRARHGAIRAPLFVGGGIAFGPKPRDFQLGLSQKMRRAALVSALTSRQKEGSILVVDGLSELSKTKKMVRTLSNLGATENPLLVVTTESAKVVRAARNLPNVEILPAHNLNTYAVVAHPKLVFMKEALPILSEIFVK